MKTRLFLMVMGLMLVMFCYTSAQVPQMINYQGKLTTAAGAPVNDTLQVVFTIYADEAGTTPLWTETQPTVEILKGVFNVLLGSVHSIPYSVFDGSTRYLGVKVGGDPEITPRKPMVSVAYAYRSAVGGGGGDNDWVFPTSAGGTNPRPYLYTYGPWGIARYSNTLYGTNDSTHVNLGVACTTGVSGQNYKYCTVGGGVRNTASWNSATVGGGIGNTASGDAATVGGGGWNTASGGGATVGGGEINTASGANATVGGGYGNIASGFDATVGGGSSNTASEVVATVGGGYQNTANNGYATVGGGFHNTASGDSATVGGGTHNTASGRGAAVGGGQANTASNTRATVGGGYCDTASGDEATVGGGHINTASGANATVGGGAFNTAGGNYFATVGGGISNTASGERATVGGGSGNTASGYSATVGGGNHNTASASYATVAGGDDNTASGNSATVGGGSCDTSFGGWSFTVGYHSVVLSGYDNSAAFNGQTVISSGQTRVGILCKASGTFTIDHPLDPDNKILNHYFVESPEMVNIYRGVAYLDANGRAEVRLPDYFDALNRTPMVQLTGVGTSDVYVAEKVTGNRFVIGGKPGTEVYWMVTGDRKDQSAEITRIIMPVEQPKTDALAGRSLDDDLLLSTMQQLERMGEAGKFSFHTDAARQRYEDMKRLLEEKERKK